jgi:hypothetical protein
LVSCDGEWVNGGKCPPLLGSFVTIPNAKRSGTLDHTQYKYLDAIHMDIAFGDCPSVSGFHYALILVDCATQYNCMFGLKALSSDCILSALCLFHASARSLAKWFYLDCGIKLFGTAIGKYRIKVDSKVVAALEKHQSLNGFSLSLTGR